MHTDDLAALFKKDDNAAPEDKPPVEIDMNVWATGWESGGDL